MNLLTVGIGVAAIVYGLVTLVLRARRPELFKKLEPMKQQWGPRAGVIVHVIGYSVVPIVFGMLTLVSGLAGKSLF